MQQKKKMILNFVRSFKKRIKKFFFHLEPEFSLSFRPSSWRKTIKALRLKNLCLFLATPVLLLFIYYLISFLRISSAELCLQSLKLSFEEDVICRESCALKRLESKNCLVESLGRDKALERKLFKYLKREDLVLSFRLELVDVFRLAYQNKTIPNFLLTCLEDDFVNEKIKAEIFKSFNWEIAGESPLAYYLRIIAAEVSLELRLAAALKISSYPNKERAFSLDDLKLLKEVIFQNQTPIYLRQSLVLLLGDYRRYFPEESDKLLAEIESYNFKGDNLSRAFAADFIGRELPEISQEEWNSYYNH